jgi:hypothetical protein
MPPERQWHGPAKEAKWQDRFEDKPVAHGSCLLKAYDSQ